ncbi:tripartite tricarboxylate transporter substrate binding protein [Xenophilus arseniciresistens]|uniref:Tripartite tricarboxylate transporter substrate binding protein n=2 Tax=Xenophilus arseniciresistens TaxID=1283306 RepID=A0AAE3NBL4_9BURK|nr:tripartite tricarboxylate transporter substrate binding protein [Xenophilus arseniciresistens]MDA7417327.1 tripartite tricarboxylate transporter substrate binding protein [Xenophilus arseniciresistens]
MTNTMKVRMKVRFSTVLCAGVAAFAAAGAGAQAWPAKPITIVVAYPAGGDTDAIARVFAEKLAPRLGQPVVVDNRPGASGVIGSSFVGKAAPDGYTLLMAPSTFTMAQLVLKTSPAAGYDVRSFTPIIQAGTQPLFLVSGPGTQAKTLNEAVAASKAQGGLAYGSPGSGSPMHVLGEMFNKASGAQFRHVPYRGVAPALTDVAGGHVPLTWMTYGPVEPYLADGKMRLLGVAQAERSPLAPQVPTLAELGVKGVEVSAWNGLYGPKGVPPEIVKTLNTHLNEIIRMPDVAAKMKVLGVLPLGGSPEVLAKTTIADLERFTRVVKELGVQAD